MILREYINCKLRTKQHMRVLWKERSSGQEPRTHVHCACGEKQRGADLHTRSVQLDAPQLRLRRAKQCFNAVRVILPMIDLNRLPVFDGPVFYMIYARFISSSRSTRGGDEVEVRIRRLGRDGRRVVTVDVHGAEVRFLEADEEARDKDGGESV